MKKLLVLFFATIQLYSQESLPTYWEYGKAEFDQLKKEEPSRQAITQEQIAKWNDLTYQLAGLKSLPDGGSTRFFAYLYAAQRDTAFLLHNAYGDFFGTLDPITEKVIHLFFPKHELREQDSDLSSRLAADMVYAKVKERYENENKGLKPYPKKVGPSYWESDDPLGLKIGSCETWLVGSITAFRLSEPPPMSSIIWQYGINQIKESITSLTREKKEIIDYWAGLKGDKSGNWVAIVNDFLAKHPIPLKNYLYFRSIFAMTQVDAMIAAFDNKYTYWVMRPDMLDPSIKPVIDVPKHPSFPSAHSVVSAASYTVLSHFFPEDANLWRSMTFDAVDSRIWGGLHYMFDNEEGLLLGERVAETLLQNAKDLNSEKKS